MMLRSDFEEKGRINALSAKESSNLLKKAQIFSTFAKIAPHKRRLILLDYFYNFFAKNDLTVFDISIATVIGPTPPGTGVILEHFGATSSKATSPTSL